MRYLNGELLEDVALRRLAGFAAEALEMNADGYWLADSGGKDSAVVHHLAERAGVPYVAHHSLTTADPPELVRHVRTLDVVIDRPAETMWQLIRRKGMPPLRTVRYCCEVLKESGSDGYVVVTGLRAAESARRRRRAMFEPCFRRRRHLLNPIFDWPTLAVWDYIRRHDLPYCRLYDEGFKRLGCVLCPCRCKREDVRYEMERWPRLARAWERAVKATWRPPAPGRRSFPSPEHMWQWWLDRRAGMEAYIPGPLFAGAASSLPAPSASSAMGPPEEIP